MRVTFCAMLPAANSSGVWNRLDHPSFEGFVCAITPFDVTAIAGNGKQVSDAVLTDPSLAGIHFTGSTPTSQSPWCTVGDNISGDTSYPRLVGEMDGKDFVIAHPSADVDALRTALVRGSFDDAGQKCSATSRAYTPRSVWERMGDDFIAEVDALKQGDPRDVTSYPGAVIDERAFRKQEAAIADSSSPYGLTGSVFARDRRVIQESSEARRFTAGSFSVNDTSTGAAVGPSSRLVAVVPAAPTARPTPRTTCCAGRVPARSTKHSSRRRRRPARTRPRSKRTERRTGT
ncbi:MAG: aldehyde dehydrogenase family protein [Microbacterium sp.]